MQRDMEYICAVWREKSFSKAARELCISQPSLSASVKRVENDLGLPLFNRATTPVSLTEAGEYYLTAARKIMEIERELREHLEEIAGNGRSRLNIGSSMFFCSYALPSIIDRFRALCPEVEATLSEGASSSQAEKLANGEIDFLLEAEALDKNIFEQIVWGREKIILAVPADNPVNEELAECRYTFEELRDEMKGEGRLHPAVSAARFAGEKFLLLKKGNDLYRRAMTIAKNAGFQPKVEMYVEQIMTAWYLVCEGRGCAFVRDAILKCVPPIRRACFYRLDDAEAERNIFLSYKKGGRLTRVKEEFIEFMRAEAAGGENARRI